jgi:formate transporter
MYFVPLGLAVKQFGGHEFWQAVGRTPGDFPNLTWSGFLVGNLLPVTAGNLIGGAILVGLVYWSIYLRTPEERAKSAEP